MFDLVPNIGPVSSQFGRSFHLDMPLQPYLVLRYLSVHTFHTSIQVVLQVPVRLNSTGPTNPNEERSMANISSAAALIVRSSSQDIDSAHAEAVVVLMMYEGIRIVCEVEPEGSTKSARGSMLDSGYYVVGQDQPEHLIITFVTL